jgi:hypothetical protein
VKRTAAAVAGLAALYFGVLRERHMRWNATPEEAEGPVAGDEFLPDAAVVTTRVVEIDAPPEAIWPWLVQMGPGRGGAYSYDWIERLLGVDVHTADWVVPELQHLAVGDEIAMPGYAMRVERLEPERALVVRSSDGCWVWSFELRPVDGRTRLLSRNRIDTSRYTATDWLGYAVMEPGSWVMERKMLLTIRKRAERLVQVNL